MITDLIEKQIREERTRQDDKWGVQNHSPAFYSLILHEEIGEVSKAILDGYDHIEESFSEEAFAHIREELIQVAAVTKAFIECLDRNKEKFINGRTPA